MKNHLILSLKVSENESSFRIFNNPKKDIRTKQKGIMLKNVIQFCFLQNNIHEVFFNALYRLSSSFLRTGFPNMFLL